MFLGGGVSEVLFVCLENNLPFVAYLVNNIGSFLSNRRKRLHVFYCQRRVEFLNAQPRLFG